MSDLDQLPEPTVHKRKRGRPSAVWIVPIVAILAAGALAIRTYLRLGPTIYITFDTAEGIEAGKSEVRYKNVPVGRVTGVDLSEDRKHIVATVKLTHGASHVAVEDSQFWVERPRIGVGGVSGLGTLLSGAYIGVDVGTADKEKSKFNGLEKPPGVTHDQPGTRFRLVSDDAGSLGAQSPIYMRRQSVGAITSLALSADGKEIELEIFVAAPYDKLVTDNTVFWNASGLDVSLDASGLRLDTQSLATVVAGGIALGIRDGDPPGKRAVEGNVFRLYDDRRHALARPDSEGLKLAMRFDQPIRGTAAGVNVEFQGIHIGEVASVRPGYDAKTKGFYFDVDALVYPSRLGAAYTGLVEEGAQTNRSGPQMLQAMVQRGLRAQIKSSNFLTGSYYIDLAFIPGKSTITVAERDNVWVVPTTKNTTDQIGDQVANIVSKIDRIPFDAIGDNVQDATHAATTLMSHLDRDVVPSAAALFARADTAMAALRDGLVALRDNVAASDSGIQQSARSALEQVDRMAFSLRGLADYLKAHPESLLRGRDSGPAPKGGK